MATHTKINTFLPKTLFNKLKKTEQEFILRLAESYRFTFQELRQVCEYARDLEMWQEAPLSEWWLLHIPDDRKPGTNVDKKKVLKQFASHLQNFKETPKSYSAQGLPHFPKPDKNKISTERKEKNIFGRCPVESEKTVCCNLKTIDAVESCIFGCSYCTIQTFYKDKITIDDNLSEKIKNIVLDPNRNYHIGTGQSSDSLAFGNKNGILDQLCHFAAEHPNIILEFKTKSDNISYFMNNRVPENIFISWTLNPQIIIDNEEHLTASLEQRLDAARKVADRGIKVGFHFHPIIYYSDWEQTYPQLAEKVQTLFHPDELIFISFGSVTFIKPVIKKIRNLGFPTKILQMKFVTDPHGKLTYSDDIKIEKFRRMHECFKAWQDTVFIYLCMEKREIWEKSLGYAYETNEVFEKALFKSATEKMGR